MSRKQFKVAGSSHEKKLSKKERRAQVGNVNKEEITPSKEDTVQIKNLTWYTAVAIGLLLMLMYWIFISGL